MRTDRRTPPLRIRLLLVIAASAIIAAMPLYAVAGQSDDLTRLPPLIERHTFLSEGEILFPEISPDGRWITFCEQYRGETHVWIKGREEPMAAARPVTAGDWPVTLYFWSQNSRWILYRHAVGGDEQYHVWAVDPRAEPEGEAAVPPARDLTPYANTHAIVVALPERTPNEILVALNDRDPKVFDLYRIDLETGIRTLLIRNPGSVVEWITDLEGKVRLAFQATDDATLELRAVEEGTLGNVLYSRSAEETLSTKRFHKDGRRIYLVSNAGAGADLSRLLLLDTVTGAIEVVESDPEGEVDFGGAFYSDATEELIATYYIGDRRRIYPRSEPFRRDLGILRRKLPDGELRFDSHSEDMRYTIVSVSRDVDPGSAYLYDRERGAVEKLFASFPDVPTEYLAPMRPLRYPARDGVAIPAYLTLPRGVEARNLPTVVFVHGGPWSRVLWGYDPIAQFLANRGYAVLQPNFRSSTGYGKRFESAGDRQRGTGVMQHDLTDGVRYLVAQGIADPERIAIFGGSYGGYAALAGLAFTPDLYAAGISVCGPSNLITDLEAIRPFVVPARKILYRRIGDPEDPEDRLRLMAQSPFFHADQIKAPLLVVQGANDSRVKQAESDQIVVALRERKRPVEYVLAPDEGHGFQKRENFLALLYFIEEFLARHLGGRYQKGAAPEIEERIRMLRVAVGTVKMPRPAE